MIMEIKECDSPAKFLNEHLNDGVKSLQKCKVLFDSLKLQEQNLRKKCKYPSETTTSEQPNTELKSQRLQQQVEYIEESVKNLDEDLAGHKSDLSLTHIEDLVNRATQIERCQSYLRCIDQIGHVSCSLQSAILTDANDTTAINSYEELVSLFEKLNGTSCTNLLEYVKDTIRYWHTVLKDRLGKELTVVMKAMEWPFIAAITSQKTKPASASKDPHVLQSNLTRLFKQMLRIQLPASIPEDVKLHALVASLPNYKPTILPMALLVEPLKKRFQYHFYGSKQTNSLDKPEWFFTQLLTWAKDHSEYITTTIQPALWNAGYDFVNAHLEFLKCLHIIAMEKLITCIPEIMYDEHLYSHLIHETLSFHGDICRFHDYPIDESSCLHVLTAEEPFKKWIVIEKKFAQEKMDLMTASATAWSCQYNADLEDDDQCKAAECAESFITLLNAVTERYEHLPYPVCQLMFVSMKRELLEDYRIRLVQLRKEFSPTSPQYLAILNTAHYIVSVLKEWIEQPLQYQAKLLDGDGDILDNLPTLLSKNASYQVRYFNLNLVCLKQLPNHLHLKALADLLYISRSLLPKPIDMSAIEELECSLFDMSIQNIASLEEEMLKSLTYHVNKDLKARLRTYADNNHSMWTALAHLKHRDEQHLISLSATACEFIIHLQNSLVMGKDALHRHLFTRFWQQIAQDLDQLIFDMVISENHFSEGGVVQFNFDMTRNLFPIIGKYSNKPENFLKLVKESCQLLTMQLGDALLLKSTLADSLHSLNSKQLQDPIGTVQEQGIFKLTPEEVELVLSRRNDLLQSY